MENTHQSQLLTAKIPQSRIVFIDSTVEDYQSLVLGVLPNTEVIILDTNQDGVEQISQVLAQRVGINSLHIVSHGAPGRVYLGNAELGQQALNNYAGQLMNWAFAFSDNAQILLYGCDVAKTDLGRAFVQCLSELTGAIVFASANKTGSAAKGGDWELKVTTKSSTATLAFTPTTLEVYGAVLAQPYLVKDINPGSGSSTPRQDFYPYVLPSYLTNIDGIVYFIANDGFGNELWRSDGTEAGTVLVKNIYPYSDPEFTPDYGPYGLINFDGVLYFFAPVRSTEEGYLDVINLWKSDGTAAGTVPIEAISDYIPPILLIKTNSNFYFSIYNGDRHDELWKSDGTEAGTLRLKELYPDTRYYHITSSVSVNDTLYFSVNFDPYGYTLWKSDGTTAGTVPITGFNSIRFYNLTNLNGTLYFFVDNETDDDGNSELWKSDGTETGTVVVKSFSRDYNYDKNVAIVNGILYFTAEDGVHGEELWKSDGTTAGTVLVKDIKPGPGSSLDDIYYSFPLIEVNNILYFTADDGTNGIELWKSDGTESGTVLIKDINPGSFSSLASNFKNVNGILYFTANDGVHGDELWRSDGTTAGTVLVKDINFGTTSSSISELTNVGDILYFNADDGINGKELWALNTNDFNIINGDGTREPLTGTTGNDRITGGTGSKTITGGAGDDEFVYTSIKEVGHRITDFSVGEDKIVLTRLLDSLVASGYNGSDAISDGYVQLVQGSTANNTIVQIDRDGTFGNAVFRPFIQLDNVTPQQMDNTNNFVF
ncbi:hypothetical protein A6770_35240 [Nostoc minutum NIES-26]|uniref:DUF4347 domain-containing protein n=1 Tax=Nostoc minutum NIES-26 TaxID=1844469 RepID=A0A367S283_9NOSO|nr:hypothetical protein A6770_35240 [Nostoc minutum NIES-26]